MSVATKPEFNMRLPVDPPYGSIREAEDPSKCPSGHGQWRTIKCDGGEWDVIECARCGKQMVARCNFDDEYA